MCLTISLFISVNGKGVYSDAVCGIVLQKTLFAQGRSAERGPIWEYFLWNAKYLMPNERQRASCGWQA